jgi:ABC-type lipoprotein release transport system permease subunit
MRNKRRTAIAGLAIGIGLAALIFTDALIEGMEDNMIRSATASFMGEGQIHREGFRESFAVEKTIMNAGQLISELEADPDVSQYASRVLSFAMINSPANLSAVTLVGVLPESEQHLTHVDETVVSGDYFQGDSEREILVGSKLAEILEVEVGSRLVLTVAQAHTGDLSQEMFRVSGTFHLNVEEMDRGMAFVRMPVAQRMLGIDGEIHEIAMSFNRKELGRNAHDPFWSRYSVGGNEAVSWAVLLPELESAIELSSFSTLIVGLILFAVVALGIVNTLFMSLHERLFEFGVLRAVGTRPLAMARLILFEAGALAVLSSILGIILGFVTTYVAAETGIDYVGIEFSGVTFREALRPILESRQFILYPICVYLFTVLVGIYPASFAARLAPADAMRRSF